MYLHSYERCNSCDLTGSSDPFECHASLHRLYGESDSNTLWQSCGKVLCTEIHPWLQLRPTPYQSTFPTKCLKIENYLILSDCLIW